MLLFNFKVCQIKIFFHVSKSHCMQSSAKRSGLIIMNHRTLFDWLFYFCILYRLNQLATIKIILKDVLKKIPGPGRALFILLSKYNIWPKIYNSQKIQFLICLGWAMQTGLFIFIRRRWELDQKIFSKFINYFRYINKTVNVKKKVLILLKEIYWTLESFLHYLDSNISWGHGLHEADSWEIGSICQRK